MYRNIKYFNYGITKEIKLATKCKCVYCPVLICTDRNKKLNSRTIST